MGFPGSRFFPQVKRSRSPVAGWFTEAEKRNVGDFSRPMRAREASLSDGNWLPPSVTRDKWWHNSGMPFGNIG